MDIAKSGNFWRKERSITQSNSVLVMSSKEWCRTSRQFPFRLSHLDFFRYDSEIRGGYLSWRKPIDLERLVLLSFSPSSILEIQRISSGSIFPLADFSRHLHARDY